MEKKNLPVDVLACAGAALLASFLPLASISIGGILGGSVSAWNAGPLFKILPNILPFLAVVALGVFAYLKYEGKWVAPKRLNLGLAIYAVSHLVLVILSLVATEYAGPGIGAYVGLGAAGYVLFLFLAKGRA